MARMAKVVELPSIAKIDKSQGKISAQLTQALREAVQSGDLQPGDPLPSSRELAQTLGVARGTVIEAYDQLLAEGVFSSQARTGTYVSHALTKKTVLESSQKETISSSIPLTKSALCYAEVLMLLLQCLFRLLVLNRVIFGVSLVINLDLGVQVLHQVMVNLKGCYH